MTMHRVCLLAAALVAAAYRARKRTRQDFPTRPVRIIVPYAPGSGTDITSRIVQDRTVALLGQPWYRESRRRPLIGTQAVANAAPDGYTLSAMDPAFVTNPQLMSDALRSVEGFRAGQPAHGDAADTDRPAVVSRPHRQGADRLRQSEPGQVELRSPGSGSGGHLAIEQFRNAFGLQMVHVPYRAPAPRRRHCRRRSVLADGGSGAVPFVQDGRLRRSRRPAPKECPRCRMCRPSRNSAFRR
jgi:tripartite-type tricarboxylate transporter receptor subunit TctC